jgi:hypothetical protein
MAQVYDQVQQALETHLLRFSDVPRNPSTGKALVAFENDRFDPVEGQDWWRVTFNPTGPPERGSYGDDGYVRVDGELYVELYVPAGEGTGRVRRLADDLVNHFKSGTRITSDDGVSVSVWRAWRSAGVEEPRWYHQTVTIWWTVHRPEM